MRNFLKWNKLPIDDFKIISIFLYSLIRNNIFPKNRLGSFVLALFYLLLLIAKDLEKNEISLVKISTIHVEMIKIDA